MVVLVIGASAFPQTKNAPPEPLTLEDVEAYNVYAALIPELLKVGTGKKSFVIQRQTQVMSADRFNELAPNCFKNPDTQASLQSLCKDFVAANQKTRLLQHKLPIGEPYRLVDRGRDDDFYLHHPEALSNFVFSMVAFDSKGEFALVSGSYECGNLCGLGGLFLLQKIGGHWKIKDQRGVMIS